MQNKTACIYHPNKNLYEYNNFGEEMRALAVLLAKKGYEKVAMLWGDADLSEFDDIWCSCYSYDIQSASLDALNTRQLLIYVANDPAFFALPIGSADRIDYIAFAGSDMDYYSKWYWKGKSTFKIRLWQEMFHARGRAELYREFDWSLGYAGNERSKWRSSRLKSLLPRAYSQKIIGCLCKPKQDYEISNAMMTLCYAQLIVGDPGYIGLFPGAHRILQGLSLSPFIFVDAKLMHTFGDEFLDTFFIADNARRIERTLWILQADKDFEAEAYASFTKFWEAL